MNSKKRERRELNKKKQESFLMFLGAMLITTILVIIVTNDNLSSTIEDRTYFALSYILINSMFCAIINIAELITLNEKKRAD